MPRNHVVESHGVFPEAYSGTPDPHLTLVMSSKTTQLGFLTLIAALLLSNYDRTLSLLSPYLPATVPTFEPSSPTFEDCMAHNYTTEILSIDPLLIYITSFVSPAESSVLLAAGDPLFESSQVTISGRDTTTSDRTSLSATLPLSPTTSCIRSRARSFLGATLPAGDIGSPQLVRYTSGQKFNLHYDWYDTPQVLSKSGQRFNRPASFFVFLEANCTGGETYFPHISVPGEGRWREHEGGTAFTPVEGNALFWVNLMPSGRGDKRVIHAGLPVEEGRKTAMNIWPREFME
ncbi:hypothetical protein V500_08722 [Pseudogymnoascus sp. VKM F-4518 (FW-2643)]|nr:hypothetical protein V500_08722 [Pseudogymnoascus sp. VKM F-4518 (FW-2643)]